MLLSLGVVAWYGTETPTRYFYGILAIFASGFFLSDIGWI